MSHIFKYYTNKWNSFDFDKSNLKDEMSWDDFNKLSKNVKLKLIEINKNKIDNNNSTYTLSTKKEPSGYLSKWYEYNKKLTNIQINLIDEYLKQSGDIDNNRQIINESNIEYSKLSDESEKLTHQISEITKENTELENRIEEIDEKLKMLDKDLEEIKNNTDDTNSIKFIDYLGYDSEEEAKNEYNLLKQQKEEYTNIINKNNEKIKSLNEKNEPITNQINKLTKEIKELSDKISNKYKEQDLTQYKKYIKQIEELNIDYADVINIGSVNELNVRKIIDDIDYIKLFELNARNILKKPPQNFKSLTLNKYINCGFADTEYCRKYRLYGLKKFENEKDTRNLERSYDNYNQLGFLDEIGMNDGVRFLKGGEPISKIYSKREIYQIFLGEHEFKKMTTICDIEIGRINLKTKKEFIKDSNDIKEAELFEPINFVHKLDPVNNNAQGLRDWFSKKVKQTDFEPLKKDFEQHVISDNERITNLETKLTELTDKLNKFINNNTVKPKHTLNFLNDITNKHNLKHIEPVQKEYYEDDSLESKLKNVLDKRRSDISPDEFTESDDESEDWGEGLKEIMTKADRPMFVAGLLGELKKDLEDYGIALNLSKDGQSYYLNVFDKNKYGKGVIEAKEIRDKTDEPAQITYTKLKEIYGDSYN